MSKNNDSKNTMKLVKEKKNIEKKIDYIEKEIKDNYDKKDIIDEK